MNKLIIHTKYHVTVELLLMQFEMVERHHHIEVIDGGIAIDHPDDVMSQDLVFWLAMVQGCGLAEGYQFGPVSSEVRLAQNILSWIDRTNKEIENDGRGRITSSSRLSILVDNIEELCKEVLKKG